MTTTENTPDASPSAGINTPDLLGSATYEPESNKIFKTA